MDAIAKQSGSGAEHPGTYRGLIEKIAYFKELGVTAVELMPVQEFNDHQVIGIDPQTPSDRGHPVGQSGESGTRSNDRAAHAVVGHRHEQ